MSPSLERRQCRRYSLSLDVHFKIRKKGKFVNGGDGKIHDVSRGGICFECGDAIISPGTALRLIVEWPVRFQGKTHLDWVVDGVVLRSNPMGTAMNIMRQRFERGAQNKRKRLAS
jgi:hypothetical protein